MNSVSFHLVIRVDDTQATLVVLEHVSADEKVASITQEVFRKLALPLEDARWCLMYRDAVLPLDAAIRLHLPATNEPLELILCRVTMQRPAAAAAAAEEEPAVSEKEVDDLLAGLERTPGEGKAASADDQDTFETDFEVPALDEESGSEATTLDEGDSDLESSEFDLPLEEGESESGSQAVPLEDEEEADEGAATVQRRAAGAVGEDEEDLEDLGEQLDEDLDEEPALAAAEELAPAAAAAPRPRRKTSSATAKKTVTRHATVRYYNRMNPDQAYPLLVAITKDAIQAITQKALDQRSRTISVAVSAAVEIEPILPGCDCYPPKQSVRIGKGDDKATFHVVPKVRGAVLGARVELRCQGSVLAAIPLEVRVVSKTPATLLCVSTLVLPFVVALLKLFKIDFEAHLQVLAGVFLAATGTSYVLARPRQRDSFWDPTPVDMLRFSCPTCQKRLKAPEQGVGRKIHCPRCEQQLLVPNATTPPPRDLSKQGVSAQTSSGRGGSLARTITANCPGCDRRIMLAFEELGQVITCNKCDTCFLPLQGIPLPSQTPAPKDADWRKVTPPVQRVGPGEDLQHEE